VRRLIQLAIVVLGIRAFLRWRKRRQADTATEALPSADPADELRQKLAETRSADAMEDAPAPEATVEERRADVHEQGRATLDDMKSSDES
jgi:hypothetical protein